MTKLSKKKREPDTSGSLLVLSEELKTEGRTSTTIHPRRRAGSPDFCKSWEECPF